MDDERGRGSDQGCGLVGAYFLKPERPLAPQHGVRCWHLPARLPLVIGSGLYACGGGCEWNSHHVDVAAPDAVLDVKVFEQGLEILPVALGHRDEQQDGAAPARAPLRQIQQPLVTPAALQVAMQYGLAVGDAAAYRADARDLRHRWCQTPRMHAGIAEGAQVRLELAA